LLAGQPAKAVAQLEQTAAIESFWLTSLVGRVSEDERKSVIEFMRPTFELCLALVSRFGNAIDDGVARAYTMMLRRKALLFASAAAFHEQLVLATAPAVAPLMAEWRNLRADIARLSLQGLVGPKGAMLFNWPEARMPEFEERYTSELEPSDLEQVRAILDNMRYSKIHQVAMVAANKMNLESWRARKADIERELGRLGFGTDINDDVFEVDGPGICDSLPRDTAFIDVVRCSVPLGAQHSLAIDRSQAGSVERYYAFVLTADPSLSLVELGFAQTIDRLVVDFSALLATPCVAADGQYQKTVPTQADCERKIDKAQQRLLVGRTLRSVVLEPLLAGLRGRTRLIFCPDGELCRLPIDALPLDDKRYVIDEYSISYVSSCREIQRWAAKANRSSTSSIVIGDPDYDLPGLEPEPGESVDVAHGATAELRSRLLSFKFRRLPNTGIEAASVARVLGVEPVTGGEAVVDVLRLCKSPFVLHLATHGFFLAPATREYDACATSEGRLRIADGWLQHSGMEEPMLRSGLALAGANTFLYGKRLPPEAGTGFLTALEACGLDLTGTAVAFLSACESGLGDIQNGDGVLGLRYALSCAGAETVVMTLWKVHDQETRDLVVDFYQRILSPTSEARADALRHARLNMKRRVPDAFYWGPFICQGNPYAIQNGSTLSAVQSGSTSRDHFVTASPESASGGEVIGTSFLDKIKKAGLTYTQPTEWQPIALQLNECFAFDWALRSKDKELEIRYAVWPDGEARTRFSDAEFYSVLTRISGGVLKGNPSRFPSGAVKKEFRADWGSTHLVRVSPDFCDYYPLSNVVVIHADGCGTAFMFYLFRDFMDIMQEMQANFYAITFARNAPL
jgi:CHAT domain-containing protein